MMRRLLTLALSFFIFSVASGRKAEHVPTLQDYQSFLKSKTFVVLERNLMSDFNGVIKTAMKNSWHLTPYEFITHEEFNEMRDDPRNYFLMVTVASFDKDRTKSQYNFLSLLRGEKRRQIDNMPDLCSIPLSYLKVEDDEYSYKMEAFLRFIQNHVKFMIGQPSLIGENSLKHYNKNIAELNGKTLYLVKEELARDVDSRHEISKIYPHPYRIVSREEVTDAIARQERDVVFLHKVGPGRTMIKARVYKILVGAADPLFYYFDHEMVKQASDDAFQAKDFKRLR